MNYWNEATIDDGSCEYYPDPIYGCIDSEALNFDPEANHDCGGCCVYPPTEEIVGCMEV